MKTVINSSHVTAMGLLLTNCATTMRLVINAIKMGASLGRHYARTSTATPGRNTFRMCDDGAMARALAGALASPWGYHAVCHGTVHGAAFGNYGSAIAAPGQPTVSRISHSGSARAPHAMAPICTWHR